MRKRWKKTRSEIVVISVMLTDACVPNKREIGMELFVKCVPQAMRAVRVIAKSPGALNGSFRWNICSEDL